ncbi:YaaR family protein [Lentibacillus sp.]|uniref:YaaR family protein n=1 Tax=Lentibacillus sp. TaxID=1925746 RepID=UPI002B4B1188|nr:YaaR family protein [Lentibacillus sp.]HLS08966.1 YaaR family protein [Lentibacillus sp.]
MKVNPELQSKMDTARKAQLSPAESRQSFNGMVQSQTHELKQQEIQQLMKNITVQGDRLARFRSFRDLAKFKRMVKRFLQETVYDGLALQTSHHFSMEGRNQKLAIVKEVDERLVELTEEIMNQERKTVDLLGLIGEIKGLLVNLYT